MSRARSIHFNGEKHWFDTSINGAPAKPNHLELLAAVENIEIDDLLDEGLNQGEVIDRLRCSLGQGGTIVIPAEIVERQRAGLLATTLLPSGSCLNLRTTIATRAEINVPFRFA
jgi:hypothetical protein